MSNSKLLAASLLFLIPICAQPLVAQVGRDYDAIRAAVYTTPVDDAAPPAPTNEAAPTPPAKDKATADVKPRPLPHDAYPLDKIPKQGVVDYEIYRDRNPYPVDPRKPCNPCTRRKNDPPCTACQARRQKKHDRIPAFQGRPHQDKEPGGCLCGKKKQKFKKPNINIYWPAMFAGVREELHPQKAAFDAATHDRVRLVDCFDCLGGFEVSPYQRRDNGYCGHGRDRYGCLGESRQLQSNVFGVGFRQPGQPVERGGIAFP